MPWAYEVSCCDANDFSDISYWRHDVSPIGFMSEIGLATATGGVAATGTLRQMKEDEIKEIRAKHSTMSS